MESLTLEKNAMMPTHLAMMAVPIALSSLGGAAKSLHTGRRVHPLGVSAYLSVETASGLSLDLWLSSVMMETTWLVMAVIRAVALKLAGPVSPRHPR